MIGKIKLHHTNRISVSAALQAHIGMLVKIPVAGTLCALERMSATRTFLYIDGYIGSKGKYEGFLKFR